MTPPLPQTRKENDPQYYGTILFCFFSPTITEIYFYVCDRVDHYEKTQGFSSVRNESGAKRNIFPIVLALLCRMKKRKRRDLPMNFGQKVQPFGWQKKSLICFTPLASFREIQVLPLYCCLKLQFNAGHYLEKVLQKL